MPEEHSPPRNHRRTNSPQPKQLPLPMPPRPIMLARPSQGYPFPVMSPPTPHDEQVPPPQKKVTVQLPTPSRRHRKAAQENDGWDTPPSSAPNSRASTPAGDSSRPFAMTRMSSTFSSGSSDATPSSSSCETPDDEGASSSSDAEDDHDDQADGPGSDEGAYREQAAAKATRRLRKQLKQAGPPTPADMVYARTKHAGSTPGAPPPAPFYHPDFDHPSDTLLDREDVRTQDEAGETRSSPGSGRSSPRTGVAANPLSNRIESMSLSQA
ncbi:hypothetical protein JCM3774_001073 [Rhodotorula dairenensis]